MRREIGWTERLENGTRRKIRVHIASGKVNWQFRTPADDGWRGGETPNVGHWESLLERMENWYRRRAATHDDLVLVRALVATARAAEPEQTASDS